MKLIIKLNKINSKRELNKQNIHDSKQKQKLKKEKT